MFTTADEAVPWVYAASLATMCVGTTGQMRQIGVIRARSWTAQGGPGARRASVEQTRDDLAYLPANDFEIASDPFSAIMVAGWIFGRRDRWHHRGVEHAQAIDAVEPQFGIDYGPASCPILQSATLLGRLCGPGG
jgi:hypothetical protein